MPDDAKDLAGHLWEMGAAMMRAQAGVADRRPATVYPADREQAGDAALGAAHAEIARVLGFQPLGQTTGMRHVTLALWDALLASIGPVEDHEVRALGALRDAREMREETAADLEAKALKYAEAQDHLYQIEREFGERAAEASAREERRGYWS